MLCRCPSAAVAGCVAMLLLGVTAPSGASTWTNADADDDWNNPNNWGGGDFTGGPGVVPTQGGNIGAAIGAAPLEINQAGLTSLYLIVNNQVDITGGDLIYTGDGLLGSDLGGGAGGVGMATINQTGGTITQTGGGSGFLVGHSLSADYSISGGSVVVQNTAPSLSVDWTLDGTASAASSLNISGTGVVDVQADNLHFGPASTLNITDDGVLIWRNKTVADISLPLSGGVFDGVPVIDPSATINARVIQVGNDVHFVVVPEPAALSLCGLAAVAALGFTQWRGPQSAT